MSGYDAFADIYDAWVGSAPIAQANKRFYVRRLVETDGTVVELGAGNGRIAIEAAKQGKDVLAVDSSESMLELAARRANEAGVSERVTLLKADFRDFELPEPAALIVIPFHTIGHLLKREDKLRALRRIHEQLEVDGKLVFDHFIFDLDYPQAPGVPHLRAEYRDPETGRDRILWEATERDLDNQLLRILVWTDDIDQQGNVVHRRYRRTHLSWMTPDETRALLEEAGLDVRSVFGDFDEGPLTESSAHQVWVAAKP